MSDKTGIAWTDATWNPVTGCSKVSPGCAHCYAETVANRFWAKQYPPVAVGPVLPDEGPTAWRPREFTDVQCHADRLDQPLRWRKRRVFVNSMSDLFHPDVPDEFIDRVFAVMALCRQHTFQVLTKRAERMRSYLTEEGRERRYAIEEQVFPIAGENDALTITDAGWPLSNVWLGVSVENQHFANERIPLLLQTPAAIRFVSYEPALGPIDICDALNGYPEQTSRREYVTREMALDAGDVTMAGSQYSDDEWQQTTPRLDWVIVGGESGPKARPCDLAWVRDIVAQCKAASVPVFVKQLGAVPIYRTLPPFNGAQGLQSNGEKLKHRKGGDPSEWPQDLRIRQFPIQREGTT